MFEIEKGVPMYTKVEGRNRYPFGEMEVGDSFALDAEQAISARHAASWHGTRNNKKFRVLKTEDGYRCWRVK